jgi:membrane protein
LEQFDEHYATLKAFLIEHLLPVHTDIITDYIDSFVANATNLGIISLSFTVIVSMFFFISFSYVVNSIFKTKDRKIHKTLLTYLLMMIIVPLGLIISFYFTSSINQFINTNVYNSDFEVSSLTPFIIEWALFFLIYKFAPNVYVYYKAAAISAFIAMIIWSASKALFVHYVFLAKATSTIYGPFAMVIFFLTWIYLSWIIFVYGLRLCYLINRSYGYSKSHQKK